MNGFDQLIAGWLVDPNNDLKLNPIFFIGRSIEIVIYDLRTSYFLEKNNINFYKVSALMFYKLYKTFNWFLLMMKLFPKLKSIKYVKKIHLFSRGYLNSHSFLGQLSHHGGPVSKRFVIILFFFLYFKKGRG